MEVPQLLLGRTQRATVWDEGVALRCFYEDFHLLIPQQALAERPLIPLGGWDDEAERVIEAARRAPLRDPVAQTTRDSLIAAMEDELEIARGRRTPEAVERQTASARTMTEAWAALVVTETAEVSRASE